MGALNVRVSKDLIGKAILGSICVVMYHAFSRLTCIDGRAARLRLLVLGSVFVVVFVLDQVIPSVGHLCPHLLFGVLIGCKLAYSTGANILDEEESCLKLGHLLPFRPTPKLAS